MSESHITGAPADAWPLSVQLMDTRMGYMHALQAYIYEMATLAMGRQLRGYAPDKLAALVSRAQGNLETWEELRQQVSLTLVAIAAEEKARVWEQTAGRVHADLQACIERLCDEMRGM